MNSAADTDYEMLNLVFFESSVEDCLQQLRTIEFVQGSKVVLHTWNNFAAEFFQHLGGIRRLAVLSKADQNIPSGIEVVDAVAPGDVFLANEFDPDALSSILMEYLDAEDITIFAPVTKHYFQNRPLFLISIPKGGTHLLYRLAESVGYQPAIVHHGDPNPGNWYCVEYSNSHTVAKDFFIDSVRRASFGNRHHPFPRTPTLFVYRNPLDIVVSEANYYHREGATIFSSYLRHMEFEDRLLRLIDDPYLLGSIRDRVNNFVPWFDFENVIPVSFEELIGSKGGGDDLVRNRLIWSLQLKLHIPGVPNKLGAAIFDESSPTFHEGRIGTSRQKMTPAAMKKFMTLNNDFMRLTGYMNAQADVEGMDQVWEEINYMSCRTEEFRRRPMRTSNEDFRDTPFNVEWNFLGHNIVRFDGRYFGLRCDCGPIDLIELRKRNALEELLFDTNLETLKSMILMKARN